jgi:hypothetical protein
MFESSRDILNYTLAASAAILTFFIAWILWYFVKIFRDVERVIRQTTAVIDKFSSVLDLAKDQMRNAAAIFPLIIKGGEKVSDMLRSMRERHDAKQANEEAKNKNKKKKSDL